MAAAHSRVLLRGGAFYAPTPATAMLTVDGRVEWLGDEDRADRQRDDADVVVDLDGRLVTPGFVDAHAHLAATGFALQSVDLGGTTSLVECLRRLSEFAHHHRGAVLFAHGWDETRWPEGQAPTTADLDAVVGDKVAYVSRVDSHSAVVSSALLARRLDLPTLDGWRGNGLVERDAHHAAREVTHSLWTYADREAALLTALRASAARGITSIHELNAPHIAPTSDFVTLRQLRAEHTLPEVVPYWGALLSGVDPATAEGPEHGDDLAGFAGDLCVDGAIGSRTACMRERYRDDDTCGHLYLDALAVRDHVVFCTESGTQAGFHVIGDRAVDEVVAGFRQAADKLGVDAIVAARHRLEHVEMPDPESISWLARLGVVASVQPAFDAAWGGAGQMYEQRLGSGRAAPMNPWGSMQRAGVILAFGSDSPVTPLDPWGAVRAATLHHSPDERLTVRAAFDAHTRGGHRARRRDDAGVLVPGAEASYAVWDVRPDTATGDGLLPGLSAGEPTPTCLLTTVHGRVAYDAEGELS